jgi:hypothetical protein
MEMDKVADFYRKASVERELGEALWEAGKKAREDHIAALMEVARDFGISLERGDFDPRLSGDAERAASCGWSRRKF